MVDLTLDQAIPIVRDLAVKKAGGFVRRCGMGLDEREDVASRLVLTFITHWPKFDSQRASVRTFASRVMDAELTSILRYHLAPSRREQDIPVADSAPSSAARGRFRVDLERALAPLPSAVQETALALFWYSTVETAEALGCSRQIVQVRKRQIREALDAAGIGPRYFSDGGAR